MKVGEEKTVKIKADDAYGPKNKNVQDVPKFAFEGIELKEGEEIEMYSNVGPVLVDVVKVEDETIKAIINHPMAGKDLTFKIKLNKILDDKEVKKLEAEMVNSCSSCGGNCEHCH